MSTVDPGDIDGADDLNDPTFPALPRLISLAEVGEYLGRDIRTVRRWIAASHLSAVRIGPARYVRESDLLALIDRQLTDRLSRRCADLTAAAEPMQAGSVASEITLESGG